MNPNYEYWLSYEGLDADTRRELESIAEDADEIEARFAVPMRFGTAGLRSVMAAGHLADERLHRRADDAGACQPRLPARRQARGVPSPTTAATTRCALPRRRQRCWRATA